MGLIQKEYRYTVGYFERGKWVQVLQTDFEDIDTFELIANAEEFQYRICCFMVYIKAALQSAYNPLLS